MKLSLLEKVRFNALVKWYFEVLQKKLLLTEREELEKIEVELFEFKNKIAGIAFLKGLEAFVGNGEILFYDKRGNVVFQKFEELQKIDEKVAEET